MDLLNITKCVLTLKSAGVEWTLEGDGGGSLITKTDLTARLSVAERRRLESDDAIYNVRILLRDCAPETWEDAAPGGDSLAITCDKGVFTLSGSAEEVFTDVRRYIEAYFSGTVKSFEARFHSFDGGGPEYTCALESAGVATWSCRRQYLNPDHERMCGAGFDVVFTFHPLRPGKTSALVKGMAFYGPEPAIRVRLDVSGAMAVSGGTEMAEENPPRGAYAAPQAAE
ncbi:MAG: hypothetical protein IKZ81_02695 [Clostridia bacterium]|nr:hypothetical protein [Clostridia bacterium]